MPDHIDPEAIDAFAQPEPHHLVDRLADRGIAPVQVRLLGQEGMIIILSGRRIYFQALPPNSDSQLFGGPPSGPGSRQMYQSRL